MFCQKCGKELDDDARFCEYCGAAVNRQSNNDGEDDDYYMRTRSKSTARKTNNYHQNSQNHRSGLIIGSIGGATILLIFLAFFWHPGFDFLNKFLSQKEPKQSTSETITLSQSSTPIPKAASSEPITEEIPAVVKVSEEGLIRANTEPRVKGKCAFIFVSEDEIEEEEFSSEAADDLEAAGYVHVGRMDSEFYGSSHPEFISNDVKDFGCDLIVVESLDKTTSWKEYALNNGASIVTFDYLPYYLEELKAEETDIEDETEKKNAGIIVISSSRNIIWSTYAEVDLWEAGYDVEIFECENVSEKEKVVSDLISKGADLLVVRTMGTVTTWRDMAEENGIHVVTYNELADYLKSIS